jgi:hypothetical protein
VVGLYKKLFSETRNVGRAASASFVRDAFGDEIAKTYRVVGEPVTVEDDEQLANDDPYQFQWWSLGLVGARPQNEKKGC